MIRRAWRPGTWIGATAAVALAVSCGTAPGADRGDVPSSETLREAPQEVSLGGTPLRLEVEAWRSFQPTMDRLPNRLIAVLRLKATTGAVPPLAALDAVWLQHGSETVRGIAREEQPRDPGASNVEFVLRDGPMWSPGDSIDVVASVSEGGRGATLLRAPRVAILRVD